MILIFLGSWRSTLIIAASIPLSILMSLFILSALGETINIMTLGGLALAVGILVDDATVEIENINRNIEEGKEVEKAILDGAAQIAVPAFVSTLSICIVFVPMFFLTGVARYLFVPLAEAVCLRDALVVLPLAHARADDGEVPAARPRARRREGQARRDPGGFFVRFQRGFEHAFRALPHRRTAASSRPPWSGPRRFAALFLAVCVVSVAVLLPWLGRGLLSRRRQRADQAPPARAHGNAHRGNGRLCDRDRRRRFAR